MIFLGMRDRSTMLGRLRVEPEVELRRMRRIPGHPHVPSHEDHCLIRVSSPGFMRNASARFVIGPIASTVTSPGCRSISEIRYSTPPLVNFAPCFRPARPASPRTPR